MQGICPPHFGHFMASMFQTFLRRVARICLLRLEHEKLDFVSSLQYHTEEQFDILIRSGDIARHSILMHYELHFQKGDTYEMVVNSYYLSFNNACSRVWRGNC